MPPIIPALNSDQAIRKLTDIVTQLAADVEVLKQSQRVNQLNYASINDTAIPVYGSDPSGVAQLKLRLGKQPDGTYAITYYNGAAPPNPIGIGVAERQLGILVTWDGTFAGNAPRPADFERLDVYIGTTSGFTPSTANLMGSLFTDSALFIGADVTTHYVKVATVNTSGVASFPSFEIAVTPLPAESLAAGSVTAVTLASELILATQIIIGSTSGSHIQLDPTYGAQFFGTDGSTQKMALNIGTGNAQFTGDLSTQTGPDRIVLTNSTGNPELQLYRVQAAPTDKAYITAVGESSDATIDLISHSGPDKIFTPNREMHLQLSPDYAEVANVDRPDGVYRGARVFLSRNTAGMDIKNDNGSGATFGGSVYLDNTSASLVAYNSVATEKGIVQVNNTGDLFVHAEGGTLNLQSNDRVRLRGWWGSMLDPHPFNNDEALMIFEYHMTDTTSTFTDFTYPTTMASILLPIVTIDSPGLVRWVVQNNTLTGFRVAYDPGFQLWIRAALFRK